MRGPFSGAGSRASPEPRNRADHAGDGAPRRFGDPLLLGKVFDGLEDRLGGAAELVERLGAGGGRYGEGHSHSGYGTEA